MVTDLQVSAADDSLPTIIRSDRESITRTWANQSLIYQSQWHNSFETDEEIAVWHAAVPELLDWWVIGQSYQGKNITCLRITNEQITEQKAKTFIVAEHHAREQITVEFALRFILYMINGYGVDSQITEYLDTIEIYLIPALNPDSLNLVVDEGNYWLRRNMRPFDADEDGVADEDSWEDVDGDGHISSFERYEKPADFINPVEFWYEGIDNDEDGLINEDYVGLVDLNRNYPTGFGEGQSSDDPLYDTYHGDYAFSEPETQALRDFVLDHRFAMAYALHSGINATYLPTTASGIFPLPTLYWDVLDDYAEILPSGFNEGYGYGAQKLESANSGMWDEWMYVERGTTLPVTFEVYHNGSADTLDTYHVIEENATHILYEWDGIYPYFAPVESYIDKLWDELLPAFDYLLVNTPRLDIDIVAASYDDTTLTGNLSVSCIGHRLDTVESIKVLDSEGTILYSYASMDPGDSIQRQITFDLAPRESVFIKIGNNYTGFAEYTIYGQPEVSTSISSTSSTTSTNQTTPSTGPPSIISVEVLVIIAGAGVAIVVIVVIIMKRRT